MTNERETQTPSVENVTQILGLARPRPTALVASTKVAATDSRLAPSDPRNQTLVAPVTTINKSPTPFRLFAPQTLLAHYKSLGHCRHSRHYGSSVHPRHCGSSVHPPHCGSSVHPRHGGSSVHPPHCGSSVHPRHGGSSVHPPHCGSSVHPPHCGSSVHPPALQKFGTLIQNWLHLIREIKHWLSQ